MIIKGKTDGRTLNVQAEKPFNPAEINFPGEIIIAMNIKTRKTNKKNLFFFKNGSFYLTKISIYFTINISIQGGVDLEKIFLMES